MRHGVTLLLGSVLLFMLSDPSGAFPDVFERSVAVAACPETAEDVLYDEDGDADEEAAGDAESGVESPVIIYGRADDALGDIVGHAHFAVRNQGRQQPAESLCAVIAEDNPRGQHQHETEVGEG